jgi:hypothetical protein
MAVELVPLCNLDVILRDPIVIGDGPAGNRMIFEVESVRVTGERISGKMVGQAAADWLVVHGSVGTLDVRATLETDDGALVYAHYQGRALLDTGRIYVAPMFETSDERYDWLNAVQAVGKGTLEGNRLRYEWYEVR